MRWSPLPEQFLHKGRNWRPTENFQMKGLQKAKTGSKTRVQQAGALGKPPRERKRIVIVAGEASADLHGANLVKAMKRLNPELQFLGIGGNKMEEAGVHTIFSSAEMAVVGLTEILGRVGTIYRAARRIKSILRNLDPDLLVLIDYPGFNIHIARTAKRNRIPVLYYITPQVWAWRRGRIRKMARRVDRFSVILPFEKDFYKQRGLKVDYVGHPLLDAFPGPLKEPETSLDLAEERIQPMIGLVPGSRKEEVEKLLPPMVKAVEMLAQEYPHLACVLPVAPTLERKWVQSFLEKASVGVTMIEGNIYETFSLCDLAFVTSGTVTLEAALSEIPMVVIYKMSGASFWLASRVIKVPHISLVNLVAGEEVVPELIQEHAEPRNLVRKALMILEDDVFRRRMVEQFKGIRRRLGQGGASIKTARIALEMMETRDGARQAPL